MQLTGAPNQVVLTKRATPFQSLPILTPSLQHKRSEKLAAAAVPVSSDGLENNSNPVEGQGWSRFVAATGATVLCYTLMAARCSPASAEEREWRPRRHYRRLGERYTNNWAYEVVEEQERNAGQQELEREREHLLQIEREKAEAIARRAEEAARRQKAEAILKKQLAQQQQASNYPFSVKIGGTETAPFIIWGGLAILVVSAFRGVSEGVKAVGNRGKSGKMVADRSLGGKQVWVEEPASTNGRTALSDRDFDKLTSIAAAAASASKATTKAPTLPAWWNPGARLPAPEPTRTARKEDAERLLLRMEALRNMGQDFELKDIIKLREFCQEGGDVTVKPKTVGGRDALYDTAVDATVNVATDPAENAEYAGEGLHTRFLSALATDIGMPEDKAIFKVCTKVAAQARARLLDALKGIREDAGSGMDSAIGNGEMEAVLNLARMDNLLTALPVLEPDNTEVQLIADSFQRTFTVDERRRAFYLLGQMSPGSATITAALLGFDPQVVVPQLMADIAATQK